MKLVTLFKISKQNENRIFNENEVIRLEECMNYFLLRLQVKSTNHSINLSRKVIVSVINLIILFKIYRQNESKISNENKG